MSIIVDAKWYLETYPDVAAAGVDPHLHYRTYGQFEGRLPRLLHAVTLETALWGGFSRLALPELTDLVSQSNARDEQIYAAWVLMRWYASELNWVAAGKFILMMTTDLPSYLGHLGPVLLVAEVLLRCGRRNEAQQYLRKVMAARGKLPDLCLAAANVCLTADSAKTPNEDSLRLLWVNCALADAKLAPLSLRDEHQALSLDNLKGTGPLPVCSMKNQPKISVIMPVFNAVGFVETALRGLLDQSWENFEVLVIDDCSTDATAQLVQDIALQDERIVLLRQTKNAGAYAARNVGLRHATGDLMTNHDSDDWSHPERLERMAQPFLANEQLVATMANWVRADTSLHFQRWRMEEGLILPSVSTLMFRRTALEQLGGWDEVRVEADTELYQRILRVWGDKAVLDVLPGIPLVFARQEADSLTGAKSTHLRTQFWGLRRLYRELSNAWHERVASPESLHLAHGAVRSFPAPAQILGESPEIAVYDWVLMTDCGGDALTCIGAQVLIERLLEAHQRIGLFHWPDFNRLQDIAGWFLEQAVMGRLDLLLPDQKLKSHRVVILGTGLQDYPPDSLPQVKCSAHHVIDDVAELESFLPPLITVKNQPDSDSVLIGKSGLFNADWYLYRYPDVAAAGVDPLAHYLAHGGTEGREPGPGFDTAWYIGQCSSALQSGEAPLQHYLKKGRAMGYEVECREVLGALTKKPGQSTIMLCAHAADKQMFGAERNLLDVLEGFTQLGMTVLVSVPGMVNQAYIEELRARSHKVFRVATEQWNNNKPPCSWAVTRFSEIIRQNAVDMVLVNTLMLREPLIAARDSGVPALVFVHESLEHDEALCQTIGLPARKLKEAVLQQADGVVANSAFTASKFNKPGATWIVGNIVDQDALDLQNLTDPRLITVAMISSNLPKKGLDDFIEVAHLLQRRAPRIRMLLIGPENEHTLRIQQKIHRGELSKNLQLIDYTTTPAEAMAQANIILNLSHFEETFGRTILEAMAARRPVVAYHWGALPELIEDGLTGFLVPFKDVSAVAEKLELLSNSNHRITTMGAAGRSFSTQYDQSRLVDQLREVYLDVLKEG